MSVVDDELDIMSLFKDALSQIDGTQVFGFTDSVMALEHFKINCSSYDLVLSDFRMPVMNGIELLKEIKSFKTPVRTILISAFYVDSNMFEECNCVDTFLQKPVSMCDLVDAVESKISTRDLTT